MVNCGHNNNYLAKLFRFQYYFTNRVYDGVPPTRVYRNDQYKTYETE